MPPVPVVRQMPAGVNAINQGFQQQNMVIRPNDREVFHQPLYDRKNLASALTGEVAFFTKPVGDSDYLITYETGGTKTKTKRDTNLPSNGQDPSKDYSVFGMAVVFTPTARTVAATAATNGIRRDKDNIREGGWLNFKVIDKSILDIPLYMMPELNGESSVSTTANNSTVFGGPQFPQNMWSFGVPIQLPKSVNFSVVCKWDGTLTLAQSFDMAVVFFAKVRRPI